MSLLFIRTFQPDILIIIGIINWNPILKYLIKHLICTSEVQLSLVRLDWSKFGIQRIIIARYIIAQCKYPPFSYITQNRRCLCISNKKDTSHSYIYFFSNLFQYINLDLFPIFDAIKSLSIIGITWSKKSMDLIRFASHNSLCT